MGLPREPWLPEGTLRFVLAPDDGVPEAALAAAIEEVGLAALVPRLGEAADWAHELEPADRLRLACARLLLARPGLVVVEELAGALPADELHRLSALLDAALPEAILLAHESAELPGAVRIELAPAGGLPAGSAARARRRPRQDRLLAWLRRGFGPVTPGRR
jgi:ABC-type transport system involved in cytochrome bd biosynthesis fused ATPase/permease subunit